MKLSLYLITVIGITFTLQPAISATNNDAALVKQFARGIVTSEAAVACGLRTADWRKSVFLGYFASARIAVMSEQPGLSDRKVNARAMQIFKAAKVEAAFHAKFGTPTRAECDTLENLRDMQDMDATAKIGLIFGAVNE